MTSEQVKQGGGELAATATECPKLDDAGRRRIIEALAFTFSRPRKPIWYRIGIWAVAGLVMVLPLLYLGIIAAVAYGAWLHLTLSTGIFDALPLLIALLAYVTPACVAAVLIAVLLKPLLARNAREKGPMAVRASDEPFLYEFVTALCRTIGVPPPQTIHVDCEPNGSIGFHRGSALFARRRAMTIGLPLVACLSLHEFAAVLAHEFGHLAHGAGMRAGRRIGLINAWFSRLVFERDAWDIRIERAANRWAWSGVIARLAQGAIWLTRRVLHGLLWVAAVVSCWFSRQMELIADRFSILVVGSAAFERTQRMLRRIMLATGEASSSISIAWAEKRRVDSVPALVAHHVSRMSDEELAAIDRAIDTADHGRFATHPSDKQRIAAAHALAARGAFSSDLPATVLFASFPALCAAATNRVYRDGAGASTHEGEVLPVAAFTGWHQWVGGQMLAQEAYFQGFADVSVAIPVKFPIPEPPPNVAAAAAALTSLRDEIVAAREQGAAHLEALHHAEQQVFFAQSALAMMRAGVAVDPNEFRIRSAHVDACKHSEDAAIQELKRVNEALGPLLGMVADRLATALSCRTFEQVVKHFNDPSVLGGPSEFLVAILMEQNASLADYDEACRRHATLAMLAQRAPGRQGQAAFDTTIALVTKSSLRANGRLRQRFKDVPYPFEHAIGKRITIADYLVPTRQEHQDLAFALDAGARIARRFPMVYFRVLGELAQIAAMIESAVGLAPLAPPPRKEQAEQHPDGS